MGFNSGFKGLKKKKLFISLTDGFSPAHLILPVLGYNHKP